MIFVAGENLLPMLVALLIGFITGLWVWKFARRGEDKPARVLTEDAPLHRPYVDNRPSPVAEPRFSDRASPRPEPEVLARRAGRDPGDRDVVTGAAAVIGDVADPFMGIDARPGSNAVAGDANRAADDLQVMKGVGPKLASLLRAEGITRFDQIAALTAGDLARLDAHLGAFRGRLVRDRIVDQAAFLAVGDRTGYERAFGKL